MRRFPIRSLRSRAAGASAALACAAVFTFVSAAVAQGGSLPIVPQDPAKFTFGAPTIIAEPGKVTIVASGQVFTTYTGCGTQPIQNAVAFAARMATPGDVIGVKGMHGGIRFLKNPNGCHQEEIGWPGNAVIQDIVIVGMDQTATIDGVEIYGDYLTPGEAGVDGLTFSNLTLRNSAAWPTPFLTGQYAQLGVIRIYDCNFQPVDPTAWQGYGMKWGIRAYKPSRFEVRDSYFHGALEHGIAYIESVGEDGLNATSGVFLDNVCDLIESGRTVLQFVARRFPIESDPSYTSDGGTGTVIIRRNIMAVDSNAPGGGGAVVTFVGHLGNVFIEDNDISANDSGVPGGGQDTGGIVFWSDTGHGLILSPAGFTTTYVYVSGNDIHGNGTRPCVAPSGCETANIAVNTFAMSGDAVVFWNAFGGPIPNGLALLPPSNMAGWQQGGHKAIYNGVVLTDMQIDNRF